MCIRDSSSTGYKNSSNADALKYYTDVYEQNDTKFDGCLLSVVTRL